MILEDELRTGQPAKPNATLLPEPPSMADITAEPDSTPAALARIDRTLSEIRGILDAHTRERQHREFSPLRLIGAILQVIVLGLLVLALLDWLFQVQLGLARVYVKLAFALVLQVMALTAFVVGRRDA